VRSKIRSTGKEDNEDEKEDKDKEDFLKKRGW
jgi:hypothetical protein